MYVESMMYAIMILIMNTQPNRTSIVCPLEFRVGLFLKNNGIALKTRPVIKRPRAKRVFFLFYSCALSKSIYSNPFFESESMLSSLV